MTARPPTEERPPRVRPARPFPEGPGPARPGDRGRRGVALVVVILMTLALSALGHAALVLIRTQQWIVRADAGRVEAGYQAAAALAAATAAAESLPGTGERWTPHGTVRALRLSAELNLLRSGPRGIRSRGRLLYAPAPVARAADREAGVRTSGTVWMGAGAWLGAAPDPDWAACPAGGAPIAFPQLQDAPADGPHPGLGPVDLARVLDRLPVVAPGLLVLASTTEVGGECQAAPDNWGDPSRPGGACRLRWGRGGVDGALVLAGAGQGLLAVEGDLEITAGARFRGWLLVGGELRVGDAAHVTGLVDARGDLHLAPDARLEVDACSAGRALAEAYELRRPWTLGPDAWPSG